MIDALDRAILDRYQRDTRESAERIGQQVGLSAAAVQRRLKRLRESGIIVAETAQLDCVRLGFGLTAIVNVDLADESGPRTRAFRDKACAQPEVQQCYGVAGAYDFVLVVVVADVAAYDAFSQRCLLNDPNVRSYTTHVVLDAAQRHGPLPVGRARDNDFA